MSLTRRFDEIVSGQRRGLSATLARGTLQVLEAPYAGVVALRNRYYDRSPHAVKRVKVPVISVGNLTMGGTGKTPMVAWLARWFQQHELCPVIVSRGYGSEATQPGQPNDEALELQWQLPGVAHVQNPDRWQASREAIDRHGADVIILDDGFQHRRLHRDLNIVLLDATQPFGYGHVFPRGTLREPLNGLRRADVVVITRSRSVDGQRLQSIRKQARAVCPRASWLISHHRPLHLVNRTRTLPLDALGRQPIAAFCGIGRPAAFRKSLEDCDFQIVAFRAFADHQAYSARDLESLNRWVQETAAVAAICTQKDYVKIGAEGLEETPLWSLAIEMAFDDVRPLVSRLQAFL